MLKYNPFNQELANVIDGLRQQITQLRNDVEFLSVASQRADDRLGGGKPVISHVAVPVALGSVDEKMAEGSIKGFGFGAEYEWMQGINSSIKAVNVLNAMSGGTSVFHNLSLESDVAEIAIADPSTNSGGIFHFVLGPSDVYEGGFVIDASFCKVYNVTRNLDDGSVSWKEEGEEEEEGFVPPDGQRQNDGEYGMPLVRLNGEGESGNEEKWQVQVYTYCKPDITVECLDDQEEPDP